MINRLLIRTRALQAIYATKHAGSMSLEFAETQFFEGLKGTYDLYLLLLQLIPALTERFDELQGIRRNRYIPTDAKHLLDTRLVNNRLSAKLANDLYLSVWYASSSFRWDEDITLINKLVTQIENSDVYAEYLESEDCYESDRAFWVQVFKRIIAPSEDLASQLEDWSSYWDNNLFYIEKLDQEVQADWDNLDKLFDSARGQDTYTSSRLDLGAVEVVKGFVEKTLRRVGEFTTLQEVLLPMYRDEEDERFALHLLRQTLLNYTKYSDLVAEYITDRWDRERIATMDMTIMCMAVTEFFHFPSIPTHVTINEYVELSKIYSTPKSGSFVNGVLDKVAGYLKGEGKIIKS